jgi:hypothetical protein
MCAAVFRPAGAVLPRHRNLRGLSCSSKEISWPNANATRSLPALWLLPHIRLMCRVLRHRSRPRPLMMILCSSNTTPTTQHHRHRAPIMGSTSPYTKSRLTIYTTKRDRSLPASFPWFFISLIDAQNTRAPRARPCRPARRP